MIVAKGKIKEIVVARMMRGENLYDGVKQICKERNIQNGVIISMIGSLNGVSFYDPIVNPEHVSGISYGAPIKLTGPIELVSVQGEICHDSEGTPLIHMHATFSDKDGKAYAGHLMDEKIEVLNVLNIFIGIIEGVDMGVKYEAILGGDSFYPKEVDEN